jgi:ubiquinone/menaquinone biosynthesis C-methylase UbiE
MERFGRSIQRSYDSVAAEYASQFFDELSRKPFDRQLLDAYADQVHGYGMVCDVGCGPGHVASYLQDRGVKTCGLDLSAGLLAQARRLNLHMPFIQGDMLALPLTNNSLGGITAFYAIIHLRRDRLPDALREFYRVLQPGGRLLLAFHGGEGDLHNDQFLGKPASFDATFFTGSEVQAALLQTGFTAAQIQERDPYPFEYASRRVYVSAAKD